MIESFKIISSQKSWIEGEAIRQLKNSLELPGMTRVVGMPDLHPGKGNPVGAAFVSTNRIYPFLVGNDIGCGIGLWQTDLLKHKAKKERWAKKLGTLEGSLEMDGHGNMEQWFTKDVAPSYEGSIGTIGLGNHFAELQAIEEVVNEDLFSKYRLDSNNLYICVHSGSRGLGEDILRWHVAVYGATGFNESSADAIKYMESHNYAVRWARLNRSLIAMRMADALSTSRLPVLDICHNSVTKIEEGWLHRKGAAPSDQGLVLIAGSRGAMSYLVEPTIKDHTENAWSIAHGAGRKWGRSAIRDRLKGVKAVSALTQTKLGGLVICDDRDLLFEEAPEAYKNIEIVIEDLKAAGLIQVIASLRPLITYKCTDKGYGDK